MSQGGAAYFAGTSVSRSCLSVQAKAFQIRTRKQALLVQLPEHIISVPLLLSMEFQLFCTLIIVPRNFFLGLMGCWMKMRSISRNMENLSLGILPFRCDE